MTEKPHGQRIGAYRNEWRRRTVYIYDHPTDPARVITQGVPFDSDEHIWTDEPRDLYRRYIGTDYQVYE